jgi:glucose/arabinose dehydrogenase
MQRYTRLPFLLAFLCVLGIGNALAVFPTLYLKNVCDDQLHAPTNITNAGDGSGRLFICDQPGKIYIFQNGMLLPTPFLDVGPEMVTFSTAYSERGLLGMCFHPDYANSSAPGYRCFYVNYTAPNTHPTLNPVGAGGTTNCVTVIAEYKVSLTNPNLADPATKRIVLTYGQPQSNHNGGQLEFGPDGYLYIASGDGGGANDNPVGHTEGSGTSSAGRVSGTLGNGQDRRQLLGKILRIAPLDPDGAGPLTYSIPPSNPFVGLTQDFADNSLDGPMRGEIYAYGMRNPWRFCFDSNFGGAARFICADVGQLDVEEIDFITSGGNYGWRMKEGTVSFDSITAYGGSPPSTAAPIAEYAHPTTTVGGGSHGTLPGTETMQRLGASITGGHVYHGSAIPALQGKYVFADYAQGGITVGGGVLLGLEETSPGIFALSNGPLNVANPLPASARIYCFGKDENGELYFAAKTASGVLQLDANSKPTGTIYKIQGLTTTSLDIYPDKDNTMYEGSNTSNGRGPHLYSGMTGAAGGEARRRALLRFPTAAIPAGITLTSATVTLRVTKQIAQDFVFGLHKMSADWGEGTSNASEPGGTGATATTNDATWNHRFYSGTLWTSAGAEGSYAATASATKSIGNWMEASGSDINTWTGGTLLTDVQGWITTPASNYGWMLRGDATEESTPYTATRFASRNYGVAPNTVYGNASTYWPKLTVTYTSAPPLTRFETWYGIYFPTSPPGTYMDPKGDNDGDGIANQIEYAYNFSPLAQNTPASGLATTVTDDTINTTFTMSFRRDPRATDLTYELQTSDDLVNWTTIATSTSGGVATGSGFISESAISGESPMRLVTAAEELPGLEVRRFVQLKITRGP